MFVPYIIQGSFCFKSRTAFTNAKVSTRNMKYGLGSVLAIITTKGGIVS